MPHQPTADLCWGLPEGVEQELSVREDAAALNLPYYLGVETPPQLADLRIGGRSIWQSCEQGVLDTTIAFVVSGVDVNALEGGRKRGRPLHYAMLSESQQTAAFLLEQGADVNAPDAAGKTPLMWAVQRPFRPGTATRDLCETLLKAGAKLNLRDSDGRTALEHALADPGLCCWLVAGGAYTETAPAALGGRGPAHWAAAEGHRQGLQFLVDRCKQLHLSEPDAAGRTPLHLASAGGHYATVQLLLRAGADTGARDQAGHTADESPHTPGPIRRLIRAHRGAPPLQQARITEVSYANTAHLMRREKLRWFLTAFFCPNWLVFLGSLMPTICGFAIIAVNGFMIHRVTMAGIKSKTPDPGLAGWYSGGLFHGSVVLVLWVFPTLDFPRIKLLWWIVTTVMFMAYMKAMFADPGTVRSTAADRDAMYQLIETGNDKIAPHPYDFKNLVKRPNRAKYCTTSQKTVHRFDHYCVWTCNTIGSGNHRPFMLFSVCQFVSQIIVQWAATYHMFYVDWARYPQEAELVSRSSPCSWLDWFFLPQHTLVAMFLWCYNLGAFVFILLILQQQLPNIHRNLTCNEVWFPDRYPWLFRVGRKVYSRYDRGALRNWIQFLCGDLETHGEPPAVEDNPFIKNLLAKCKPMPPGSGGGCCSHDHGGAAGSHGHSHGHSHGGAAPDAAGGGVSAAEAGMHRDPESGLLIPPMLIPTLAQLPVEKRREMARVQQQQLQHFGMLQADGSVAMPAEDKEGALNDFLRTRYADLQSRGVIRDGAGGLGSGAADRSSSGPPLPSALGHGDGLGAGTALEHRIGSSQGGDAGQGRVQARSRSANRRGAGGSDV